jgi:hypothetical protein
MSGHVQEEYPLVSGYGENRSKWFYIAAIAFVCWNILLFSLAVAAIAKVNDIKEPKIPSPPPSYQTSTVGTTVTIPQMNVVSLTPNGESLRNGAGTTIMSKKNLVTPFAQSSNFRIARFVEEASQDHVIAVWTNTTGTFASLGALSLDQQVVNVWYSAVSMPFASFEDLVTLSSNHFVIVANRTVWAGTATISPGVATISKLGSASVPGLVSYDHRLTALGTTYFVVTYDTGLINVNSTIVNFGAVVGSVVWDIGSGLPKVTILTPFTAAGFKANFRVHDALALTNSTFVLTYASGEEATLGQLTCLYASLNMVSGEITTSKPVVHPSIKPAYYLAAVGLDGSTGVILTVDEASGSALRAIRIHRSINKLSSVDFGDVLTVEDGIADTMYTDQFASGAIRFVDAARVSANKVVVAWADYSNMGNLTTAILTVDQANNLHASPLYVLGQGVSLDQLATYSVSVAGLSIDAYGQVGAVIVERRLGTNDATSGSVSLIEVAPKAFGVALGTAFPGQSANVIVSGPLDLPSAWPDLKVGFLYYGLSTGALVAGPAAGSVDSAVAYVTLDDGSLVSVDSAVGVAISKRQLYVFPSYQA